ncbi:MAG: hypothetical protein AAGH41_12705 [Pseudomonadota bacterium]
MRLFSLLIIAASLLHGCGERRDTNPRLFIDPELAAQYPAAKETLRLRGDVTLVKVPEDAVFTLSLAEGSSVIRSLPPVPMDRRDMAFADTIDLGAAGQPTFALMLSTRLHAMHLAGTETPQPGAVGTLRELAVRLAEAFDTENLTEAMREDLRTSYRQALFQIAMTTRAEADANVMFAFETDEAKAGRGVDSADRYARSRAWYYRASADHLRADPSVEREIAEAFTGFKNAQRVFVQDREGKKHTLRSDQELVAARVRLGQLLTAIGTLRDDPKLTEEGRFAFRSAAGIWFETFGKERPFCYRTDPRTTDAPTCIAPEEAELPDFKPS